MPELQSKIHRAQDFTLTAQMHEHALEITDFDGHEVYQNPEKLVEAVLTVRNRYGFDLPVLGYDVYNVEAELLGKKIHFLQKQAPQQSETNIIEDLSRAKEIIPKYSPDGIRDRGRFAYVLEATEIFIEKTGSIPYLQFTAPFTLAARLIDFEKLLTSMISRPDTVHVFLEVLTERVLIPWLTLQKEKFPGAEIYLGADALASPPNLSTEMLEEFVLPYVELLKKEVGAGVGIVNWWGEASVKNLEDFLELKRKVSPHGENLRVQDPDLNQIDLALLKDYIIDQEMHLTLGISARLLNRGDCQQIQQRLERYITLAEELPHLTIYFCSLGSDTPPENIKHAVSAARSIFQNIN